MRIELSPPCCHRKKTKRHHITLLRPSFILYYLPIKICKSLNITIAVPPPWSKLPLGFLSALHKEIGYKEPTYASIYIHIIAHANRQIVNTYITVYT